MWCEKFRCATIGGYMIYLIKLYVMQIRYVLWCGKTPSHHVPPWENLDPHGCFLPWFRHLNDTVTPSRLLQRGSKVHRRRARWPRVFPKHTLVSTDDAKTRFWIFKFLRGHLLVAGFFLEKKGTGVALLLKGVTKAPSCMRNVLGNLMTPAVLFVALEIKENTTLIPAQDVWLQNSECSTCVSSNEFNDQHKATWGELNIVLNFRRIELGTKLIFLHVWAKVMRKVQQRHQLPWFNLCNRTNRYPPTPKFKKSVRECTMWRSLFGETEIQTPFLPKTANIMNHGDLILENGFEAANTFFCRNHKSHLTSLCCRVSWDTVSFVFRTRRKTITSKPNCSTVSWSHHS